MHFDVYRVPESRTALIYALSVVVVSLLDHTIGLGEKEFSIAKCADRLAIGTMCMCACFLE